MPGLTDTFHWNAWPRAIWDEREKQKESLADSATDTTKTDNFTLEFKGTAREERFKQFIKDIEIEAKLNPNSALTMAKMALLNKDQYSQKELGTLSAQATYLDALDRQRQLGMVFGRTALALDSPTTVIAPPVLAPAAPHAAMAAPAPSFGGRGFN